MYEALRIVALKDAENGFHRIADVDILGAAVHYLPGDARALGQFDDGQDIRRLVLEPCRWDINLSKTVYLAFSGEGKIL